MHQDSAFAIKNINSPMFLVNFICSNLPFKKDEKMDLLSIHSLRERTYHLLEILNREVQLAEIKASIQMRAREDIDQQQREYFLQQQIKTIQDELGGGGQEQEIEEMRQKAERMRWNLEVRDTFMKKNLPNWNALIRNLRITAYSSTICKRCSISHGVRIQLTI